MKYKNSKLRHLGIYLSSNPLEMLDGVNGYYRRAYEGLFSEILELGFIPTIIYNEEKNYLGNGMFRKYWCVNKSHGVLNYLPHEEDLRLGLVFDKNRFGARDMNIINPRKIRDICCNKYKSFLFAPEWHAPTILIGNQRQFEAFARLKTDEVIVLKELDGKGGEQVFIGRLEDYDGKLTYPIIAQEFIDSSVGVEGVCSGVHDLRVALYNGKIISYMLRQPKKGEFRSNLLYGGEHRELDVERVPAEVREIAKIIDSRFETNSDRFYSIDFANSVHGWKIIELNCWPGLGYDSKNEKKFTRRLAKCLVDSLGKQGIFA
jgi:hypothetical protein